MKLLLCALLKADFYSRNGLSYFIKCMLYFTQDRLLFMKGCHLQQSFLSDDQVMDRIYALFISENLSTLGAFSLFANISAVQQISTHFSQFASFCPNDLCVCSLLSMPPIIISPIIRALQYALK